VYAGADASVELAPIGRPRVCIERREQSRTDELGEAALINRQNLRAFPWQRRNMRFSRKGRWQPSQAIRLGARHGGGRDGNMVEQTSLERFQVRCHWGRSVRAVDERVAQFRIAVMALAAENGD
jgi:hypothetical protein